MSTLDRIIYLCKKCNKTQKDLTDYLGLEKSTFTSWKKGKTASYEKLATVILLSLYFLGDLKEKKVEHELTNINNQFKKF